MPDQTASIDIKAGPGTVFCWITEPDLLLQWVEGLESVERTPPGPISVGVKSRDRVESFGKRLEVNAEVAEMTPDAAITLALDSRAFSGTASYVIETTTTGCRLTVNASARFKGMYKITGAALAPMMQRKLERDLERLKSLVESEDSDSA